ncbi:rhomboid family intramembrane serine protease [Streptomyces lichenis]|uniref:Rhomboid family intramembrane serine protease n=1 Tax=Streptomyces lichenis TaxID=2306967 RepID=A0ABT0IIL7_9ACTN|nr:rhomboid family intramembrane serine protease [Streptomyces lichenis]MCK8681175.1 rhomboid family intramembrane serine protease [Streptomyces lichenis]
MARARTTTGELTGWRHVSRAKAAAWLMAGWIALLWALELVDTATGHALDGYGVSPRDTGELRDIVPSAFLHYGFDHLMANTIPLAVMGFLAALGGIRRFLGVAALIIVADGLGVWLVSPEYSVTAGASGLVFGLFGYLVARGFVDRSAPDIVVGLLVGAIWGGSIWFGISPGQDGVSWQGHLFGLAAGILAAFVFRRRAPRKAAPPTYV